MKASAAINIIIISIIVISCIILFIVLSAYSQTASEKEKEKTKELISDSGIIIEFASRDSISVRNKGTSKIFTSSINISINNIQEECKWSQFIILPGEVASCTLKKDCSGKTVTISGSRDSFVCR